MIVINNIQMDYYSLAGDPKLLLKYELTPDIAQQAIDNDDLEFLTALFKINFEYKKIKVYANTDIEIISLLKEYNILYAKSDVLIYRSKYNTKDLI